jgi:guanylate kinase
MATLPQSNQQGLAVVISGPSGAGKTTVCRKLIERYGYAFSVSATTRAPRPGEREGIDYYFVSREHFLEGVAKGEFLEHSEHFDNLYGTPRAPIERALDEGRTILLDIDVNGAAQLMQSMKASRRLTIFLQAPGSEEQERRLRGRLSDSEASIRTRLQRPEEEIARKMSYDRWVVNDAADRAVQEIHDLVEQAKERNAHGC